jgi:hypothetical protein
MSLGKQLGFALLAVIASALAACSSGGGSGSQANTIAGAVQDLTTDPEGMTTVITFTKVDGIAAASALNFQAAAGQVAQSVSVAGTAATVTWNARVTPSDMVRAVGLANVSTSYHGVTTTNGVAPTFVIQSGTQNPGWGGDIAVLQFSGAHVIKSQAETLANWTLTESSQSVDLTGTTLSFDSSTQTLTMTFGMLANLHASFALAASGVHSVADVAVSSTAVNGTATGDSTPPNLVSAIQNLPQDEYGRVVDFTFDKSMDPVFSTVLSNFQVTLPDIATSVTLPAENILRVTFNNPIVPGVKTVTLNNIVDLHGNPFPNGPQAITQPNPVVNQFNGNPVAVTVPNQLNDYVQIKTIEAFEPNSAVDPTKWTLHVAGSLVNLANQTLDYDFLGKTLTIHLDVQMLNGSTFTVNANNVLDVDGQTFAQGYFGTVGGDMQPPTVTSVKQDRNVDPAGMTLDVTISEAIDMATAQNLANWTISGSQTLQSATLISAGQAVRLVYGSLVVPGDFTLTVANLKDLAGNAMPSPQVNIPISSTDLIPPVANSGAATAVEGANNDTLVVGFSDNMIPSEAQTPANWHVESPVGTPVSTAGATIAYDDPSKSATLTFTNGVNLKRGNNFKASFTTMRDIGGNTITNASVTGPVASETTIPYVHTVHRSAAQDDTLVVRFSEPCDLLTNLYDVNTNPTGARYILRDNTGTIRGYAIGAVAQDSGLGVAVSFGLQVNVDDTIDVLELTDLAGNPMFPALSVPSVAEDLTIPSLDTGITAFTGVSGENNDFITVKFDRPMSPWQLLAPGNYVANGVNPVNFTNADYSFDGTDTVTITLKSGNAYDILSGTGGTYNLGVNNVWSAQGTQRTTVDGDIGITAVGDTTPPGVLIGKVRLDPMVANSLLIEFTEAMSPYSAALPGNYDYNGGNIATGAQLLGARVARATFAVTPQVGQNLALSVDDLSGNTGNVTRAVTAADTQAPVIVSVAGTSTPGWGGDLVVITFDEPVPAGGAELLSHYTIKTGSTTLTLTNATATYSSITNAITIHLPGGQELDATQPLTVTVTGVSDFAGNVMPAPVQTGGPVTGDTTPPSFKSAFVNLVQDPSAKTIDVLFSEDVDQTFASTSTNWHCSGGEVVQSVTMLERNHARLVINTPLGPFDTLSITGLPDLAHNVAGMLAINPVE